MKKFSFRLQKVFEFRTRVEETAKETYMAARAARIAAEVEVQRTLDSRKELLFRSADTLEARRWLQAALDKSDDDERNLRSIAADLHEEEEAKRLDWLERKREMEALEKLREKEFAEWEREMNRREQKQLDEWAATRRAA